MFTRAAFVGLNLQRDLLRKGFNSLYTRAKIIDSLRQNSHLEILPTSIVTAELNNRDINLRTLKRKDIKRLARSLDVFSL
jgi:hypothetical protein